MFQKINDFFIDKSPKGIRKRSLFGLTIFLVLVVLAIFLLPWAKTWEILRSSNLQLILLGFALAIPAQILTALSFKVVSESQNAPISFWRLYLINFTLSFYDIVLPSTLVVSGLRWYRYTQQSRKPGESFVTIAYLKVFNIALAIALSLGLLFFTDITSINGHVWELILLLAGIIAIMFFTPFLCKSIVQRMDSNNQRPSKGKKSRFLSFLMKFIRKILEAFADFRKLRISIQIWVIVIGIANQFFQFLAYLYFAQSVGISLSIAQLGTLRAVILLASNLPMNFGVGIGLRELSLAATLSALGVSLEKVVAMTVVVFARTLFFGAIGGLVELIQILFGNLYFNRAKADSSINLINQKEESLKKR
jgi:uncharacterized protein (TIRG00374 family)